jgi:glycosyltransferase involved in cell wall biosynthesis
MQDERIAVMQVLEATVGGTRRHVLDLCLGLPAAEFRQHLVCATRRDPYFHRDIAQLQDAGVEVTVLPMSRDISPLADMQCLRELRRLIRQQQPQIVHGHSSKGGFLARLAVRGKPGVRTVYNPHGYAFQMRTSSLKQALYLGLERLAGRWTDRLVAVGESQRELTVSRGIVPAERVVVIAGGVDLAQFQHPRLTGALQRELGLPPDTSLVGTVAALTPQKGLEYLLAAAALVKRELHPAHFVVVGEGALKRRLRRLARDLGVGDTVHFLGQREDVPRLLADLSLFVLPSLWEGLPYALLEAGAVGLPVVATRIPGNCDLIEDSVTGRLVAPADALELGVTILQVLQDPTAARWGEALQERVAQHHTLAGMVAGHAQLYRELAGRG